MWLRRHAQRSNAVLAALAEVGEPGMTVTALAIAVDLPENQLESILEVLTEAGLVRHYSDGASLNTSTHTWRSHYQLVKPWRTSVTTDPARLLPRQRHGFT